MQSNSKFPGVPPGGTSPYESRTESNTKASSTAYSSLDSWDDEEQIPAANGSGTWDDPSYDRVPARRNGISSLRPLQKSTTTQDVRSCENVISRQLNHHQPRQTLPKSSRQRNQNNKYDHSAKNVYIHYERQTTSSVSITENFQPPSSLHLKCELIASDGLTEVLPSLAIIRGCNVQYIRSQLLLYLPEYHQTPLLNANSWGFLLPTGEIFAITIKHKPQENYRLFGKSLTPLDGARGSQCPFVLYAAYENILPVLTFIEEMFHVVFFERDGNPSQSTWNKVQVPRMLERLRLFLSGGGFVLPGDHKLVALGPKSSSVLGIDQEIKQSTVAALARLEDDPTLPPHQPASPLKPEEDEEEGEGDTDEDEEPASLALVNGVTKSFPGYMLTFAQEHIEQKRAVADLLQTSCSCLVLRNHYTAVGPETCLQLGDAARVMISSPLASTAGCSHSSQLSEALSAQLLYQSYGLSLHRTEMELTYVRPSPKIDFTCTTPSGAVVGVSVTRAFKGDERGKDRKFSRRVARALIAKKLNGLNKALGCIKSEQQWQLSILHVWAPSTRNASYMEAAFRDYFMTSSLSTPVILLLTSTTFDCPLKYAYIYNHFS